MAIGRCGWATLILNRIPDVMPSQRALRSQGGGAAAGRHAAAAVAAAAGDPPDGEGGQAEGTPPQTVVVFTIRFGTGDPQDTDMAAQDAE